ncbi:hypothetical protein [Rhodococcus sp. 1168]|uniref:hypothetical protein n=1 Tax=Rhodococcus sp. 1168 TaxID=2018041 RepID=UPI000A0C2E65|nr:hypothetical protein [Rhodococcus sp. 1168]ORI16379.1 hypothetical protein BJI47_15540 [Rhodococcus sp. 1168]
MTEGKKDHGPRWIKTAENRIGIIMLMAGVVAAGLLITALAGGFSGWAWIAGAATVVLIGGGFLSLRAGALRKGETGPILYHPDSPDVVLDVDRETGNRSPHHD